MALQFIVLAEVYGRKGLKRERYFGERKSVLDVYDDVALIKKFRFPRSSLVQIIDICRPYIERRTNRNHALPVHTQVLAALRFYAKGAFQDDAGELLGISQPSASRAVKAISEILTKNVPLFVRFPATDMEFQKNKMGFAQLQGFPNVINLIDGSHVFAKAGSGKEEPLYVCRKGGHSINVQLTCNPDMTFTSVVAKWPGSTHDSFIWKNCGLREKFIANPPNGWLLGDGELQPSSHISIKSNPPLPNIVPSPPDPFQYGTMDFSGNNNNNFRFPSQIYSPPPPPKPPTVVQNEQMWNIPTVKFDSPPFVTSTVSSTYPKNGVDLNSIDYPASTERSRNPFGGVGPSLQDELAAFTHELEELAMRGPSSTVSPISHQYNYNSFSHHRPNSVPSQNFIPPPAPPRSNYGKHSPSSIQIIKPEMGSFDDSSQSSSEPIRSEAPPPSQNNNFTPPPMPTTPPLSLSTQAPKISYFSNSPFSFPPTGNHYDGSKHRHQNQNTINNNNNYGHSKENVRPGSVFFGANENRPFGQGPTTAAPPLLFGGQQLGEGYNQQENYNEGNHFSGPVHKQIYSTVSSILSSANNNNNNNNNNQLNFNHNFNNNFKNGFSNNGPSNNYNNKHGNNNFNNGPTTNSPINNFNNPNNNNNNFVTSAASYYPLNNNDNNNLRGPMPTQIPNQMFQPPMAPSTKPTMGSFLAPLSNMFSNTFGLGKHKLPQMMPPSPPQPPRRPLAPSQQNFPPSQNNNKFSSDINIYNNRYNPPLPPNGNSMANSNPFNNHKNNNPAFRKPPPPTHFSFPGQNQNEPPKRNQQQQYRRPSPTSMPITPTNIPPMVPMPFPRKPPSPSPVYPKKATKESAQNDKEKIIEALETLNSVKYDDIESVAAEQFGTDLIQRIKSKKVASTTAIPKTTTERTTRRPFYTTQHTTEYPERKVTQTVSDSTAQLASLIKYVSKMKSDPSKMKSVNDAFSDSTSSESMNFQKRPSGNNPITSMSTDDITSLFASMAPPLEKATSTTRKPPTTTRKPSLELPVFGPTANSFSFGTSTGESNDIKSLQAQLAKAILAKAARTHEQSSKQQQKQQNQQDQSSNVNPLRAVAHLASMRGNSLGINSKNYTSSQIETLKKLIALNNIEKKLMQSQGVFNLSSGSSHQTPWRVPQTTVSTFLPAPSSFHNKMLQDGGSSGTFNHNSIFNRNSPVQNIHFSSTNSNSLDNNGAGISSLQLVNHYNNNLKKFNSHSNNGPSPSDPTLLALQALALRKAQGIKPQPNILLPQQTKPKEETNVGGFQPIPVDLSAILSPSPPLESEQPPSNMHRRTRLTDIKNAPKSFYPGNASLEFDLAPTTTQMYTDFSCEDQKFFPGLYADTVLSCKVFHLCAKTNNGYMMKTFRCPHETVFDQEVLRCNWNLYVDCSESKDKYHFNKYLSQSFQFLRILGEFSASYQKPNGTVTAG